MTPAQPENDWRTLAQQASLEMNPAKLMQLVTELNKALEHDENQPDGHYAEAA